MARVHCWTAGPREPDDCGTTCLEWEDHEGPHQFVRDDEIMVLLAPDTKEQADG